jgi:methyl-accepting chemotaxis protein
VNSLLRRFSQAQRVLAGFWSLSAVVLALGLGAATRLFSLGDAGTATALAVLALLCGLAGLLGGWWVRHSIKAPVEDTANAVMQIARGDLSIRIDSPGRDELSWLRAELNGMRKKLCETLMGVRQNVDSVNSAAGEIAHGNQDLSARTEQQAAALQQTSSTMNHLADTVRRNADGAREAHREMNEVSDVAAHGGQLMGDVEARMRDIHQSAQRIGEIISVIDGIAFQTNILALNAAVEAARAGEQGRGFAVVAGEVRSLAQRSASAAREITALIQDSTAKVGAGSTLVTDAGTTMRDLVQRVARVSGLVAGIAEASAGQSQGIAEVHQAIAQIDNATQQNAALVEQVAAAASSLRGQSEQLGSIVAGFRLGNA